MAPMYEKPVRLLIKDLVAQRGMKPGEILQRDEVFDWFHKNYPKIKEATIHAHLAKMSVNVDPWGQVLQSYISHDTIPLWPVPSA